MLPANLAKSRVAGPRGLGELVMVSPHGSGMLQTLRYSPYSVPVSTNTAMVAALSQQPLMANQPPPSPLLQTSATATNSPPPPYHHIDFNQAVAAQAAAAAAYYGQAVTTVAGAQQQQQHSIFPAISSFSQLMENQLTQAESACKMSEQFVPNLAELMFQKNSVLYA